MSKDNNTILTIDKDLTSDIKAVLQSDNHFAITDTNVYKLYQDLFPKNTYVIKAGEDSKCLDVVSKVCEHLRKNGATRSSKIVAVGGGVVGDLAGFCASIYMRGIEWINVPTTLLALTDSGIGGKTGVDLHNYKNMIGAFWFPKQILASTSFIATLPEREFLCGMGEVVKTACLNEDIFKFYVDNQDAIYSKDNDILFKLVKMCAEHKDYVVTNDPFEKSILRKSLNVGHTIGHALEVVDKHRRSHGEYVLHGLLIECKLFSDYVDKEFYSKLSSLVKKALNGSTIKYDIKAVAQASLSDKKNNNANVSFIIVNKAGTYEEYFLDKDTLNQSLKDVTNEL